MSRSDWSSPSRSAPPATKQIESPSSSPNQVTSASEEDTDATSNVNTQKPPPLPPARNEHYAATKGGVISMMRSIAVEFARDGVRANTILPGWIATDMTAGAQTSPAFTEKVIPRVPMRRWGEPTDFGGIAVYLASNASAFHTGDTFVIDGGYTIF